MLRIPFLPLHPSPFPSVVDKSMHRQYPSTESSHPAAERPSPPLPCLSTCLPDSKSRPRATLSHDPSRNPLALVPRDSQSTASATTSMHLYRLIWEALYASLSAFVAPTFTYGSKGGRGGGRRANWIPRGDRTSTIGAHWMNVDRNVGISKRHFGESFLI